MRPDGMSPDDPQEWLRRARSNLARARAVQTDADVLLEDLCFDAQQACEKALKALFVLRNRQVPRTHSIGDLIAELDAMGFDVPGIVRESASLTDYAVSARYPGPAEAVVTEDLSEAIRLAVAVVSWASDMVTAG